MNLVLLPDWNSLDSVRAAHSDLELAALVFFALLVVFDVLAHFAEEAKERARLLEKIGLCCFAVAVLCEIVGYRYGQRNDALSDQKISLLDESLNEAEYMFSARHVDDPDAMKHELSMFSGQPVVFRSYRTDSEGYFLCERLIPIFQQAGLLPSDQCGSSESAIPPRVGISIESSNEEVARSLLVIFIRFMPFEAPASRAVETSAPTTILVGYRATGSASFLANPFTGKSDEGNTNAKH